jgi:hypothetical protein
MHAVSLTPQAQNIFEQLRKVKIMQKKDGMPKN